MLCFLYKLASTSGGLDTGPGKSTALPAAPTKFLNSRNKIDHDGITNKPIPPISDIESSEESETEASDRESSQTTNKKDHSKRSRHSKDKVR